MFMQVPFVGGRENTSVWRLTVLPWLRVSPVQAALAVLWVFASDLMTEYVPQRIVATLFFPSFLPSVHTFSLSLSFFDSFFFFATSVDPLYCLAISPGTKITLTLSEQRINNIFIHLLLSVPGCPMQGRSVCWDVFNQDQWTSLQGIQSSPSPFLWVHMRRSLKNENKIQSICSLCAKWASLAMATGSLHLCVFVRALSFILASCVRKKSHRILMMKLYLGTPV